MDNSKKRFLYIGFLLITAINVFASRPPVDINSILRNLDLTIDSIDVYNGQKEKIIEQHKHLISLEKNNPEQLFKVYGFLQDDYFKYNSDSCKKYIDLRIKIAYQLNKNSYIAESLIDLANWYSYVSLFSDAKKILDKVLRNLPKSLRAKYYSTLNSFYYLKASYCSVFPEIKKYNLEKCYLYRDSTSQYAKKNNIYIYELSVGDKLRMEGRYKEAIRYMNAHLKKLKQNDDMIRLYANSLAQSYEKEGVIEEAKYYYAMSAISDIKKSIKETSSLWMLSSILFKEGDLKRANRYLQVSLGNAIKSKSRLRQIEVTQQMATITTAYQNYIEKKNTRYRILICILVVLSCILIYSLYFSYHKKQELEKVRRYLKEMNSHLEQINRELQQTIEKKDKLNNDLIESNNIKVEYITQYINHCSKYIESTEELLHLLIKTAVNQDKATLISSLRSSTFIDDQLADFYNNFDNTFLNIYPDFIEKLNTYLKPEERFELKNKKQLNTELRIFALIRLGVTDSRQMAKFLRCSLQTVYNYRSKNRAKAFDADENIEEKIKKINFTVNEKL